MLRFLVVIAAIAIIGLMVRGALLAAMKETRGGTAGPARRRGRHLPPDRLVCGVCSESFDPEKTGWICPKCGK